MSGRRLPLAILGLVAFLGFLAWSAPAALVTGAIADAVPGLRFAAHAGNAWRGSASLNWRGTALGRADWRVWAPTLLAGRLRASVVLDGPDAGFEGGVARGLWSDELVLRDVDGGLPLDLLAQLSGARGPLQGRVELDSVSLTVAGDRVLAADGRVRLAAASITHPVRYALGDFTLQLSADDGWLRAVVADAGGPVGVDGELQVSPARRWRLDARVRAQSADRDLALALSLLGPPDAAGYHPLRLAGTF